MRTHVTLTGRVPSKKNSRRWIKRGVRTFSVPSESFEAWHELWIWKLREVKPTEGPVRIEIEIYAGDERSFDGDNVLTSILDLLKDSKIIEDDKIKIVREGSWKYMGVDKENPRVVVCITDI